MLHKKLHITGMVMALVLAGCSDNTSIQKTFISDRDRCRAKGENFMGIYFPLAQGPSYYVNPKDQKTLSNQIYCECMKDSEWTAYGCPKPKKDADAAPAKPATPVVPVPAATPVTAVPAPAPAAQQQVNTRTENNQVVNNKTVNNLTTNNQTVNSKTTNSQTTNSQTSNSKTSNDQTTNNQNNTTKDVKGQPASDSLMDTLFKRQQYERHQPADQPITEDPAAGITIVTPPPPDRN